MSLITRRGALTGAGSAACAVMATRSRPALAAVGDTILVRAAPGATTGRLRFGDRDYPCSVGRSGILDPKVEGDGGTPAGLFPMGEVRYRPDRMEAPISGLPVFKATPTDGWCDAPADPAYNQLVRMPYQSDAEQMWRDDDLYDVLAVIGYNFAPTVPGAGSAIFLHIAREVGGGVLGPTTGCVSLRRVDVLAVLAACTTGTMIDISTV